MLILGDHCLLQVLIALHQGCFIYMIRYNNDTCRTLNCSLSATLALRPDDPSGSSGGDSDSSSCTERFVDNLSSNIFILFHSIDTIISEMNDSEADTACSDDEEELKGIHEADCFSSNRFV